MKIEISNRVTRVENTSVCPETLIVTSHFENRETIAKVQYWHARPTEHKHGASDPYICMSVRATDAHEKEHKTENTSFMTVEQARELRKRLDEAIACAEVK